MDLSTIVVFTLFGAVVLQVVVVAAAAWLLVPCRSTCPHCGESALPLVANRLWRATRLERRWCYVCGWSGLSKRHRTTVGPESHIEEPGARRTDDDEWRSLGGLGEWTPDSDKIWP